MFKFNLVNCVSTVVKIGRIKKFEMWLINLTLNFFYIIKCDKVV